MDVTLLLRASTMENPNAPPVIILNSENTTIGRHGQVQMDTSRGKEVSKIHAKICRRLRGGEVVWLIEDNDSLNGTFVNGRKIHRVMLMPYDEIVFGGGAIFHMGDSVKSTETAECRYIFYYAPAEVKFQPDVDLSATLIHSSASAIDLCAICYCPIAAPELLPCGHQFCLSCIHEWARQCAKAMRPAVCPMCRKSFSPSELTAEEGEIADGVVKVWCVEPLLRDLDVKSCRTIRYSNIFKKWDEEKTKWFWDCYSTVKGNEVRRLTFLHLMHATYKYAMKANVHQLKNAVKNLCGTMKESREDLMIEVIKTLLIKFYKVKPRSTEAWFLNMRSRPTPRY